MNHYLVGIFIPFHGVNRLYEVEATSPNEAKLKALVEAGFDVLKRIDIDDVFVSEPHLLLYGNEMDCPLD